jgi:hypothetical protein
MTWYLILQTTSFIHLMTISDLNGKAKLILKDKIQRNMLFGGNAQRLKILQEE